MINRNIVFILALSLFNFSCKKEKPWVYEKPPYKVTTLDYITPDGTTYILRGEYEKNSGDRETSNIGFEVGTTLENQREIRYPDVLWVKKDSLFQYSMKGLSPFSTYYYKAILLNGGALYYGDIKKIETNGPVILGYSSNSGIRDYSTLSIRGRGFGKSNELFKIYVYVKKEKNSTPIKVKAHLLSVSDTLVTVMLPAIIGTDPDKEPYFTNEIQLSELKVENENGTRSILIDTIRFKYDFWVGDETLKGKAGDNLVIYTTYTRKFPSINDLLIKIDGIIIKPVKFQSLFDIVGPINYGWFATRIYFKVPAGLSPGKKKISIESVHGEIFRPNTNDSTSDIFEVIN